jgi:hypothetical protein
VVVEVDFLVQCVQNGSWCVVCGVGTAHAHCLCFPIATYSMCMEMGGVAGTTLVAGLGGCGLCVCELPHTSSVREVRGTTSRCGGGGGGLLPAFNLCFLTSICVVSARMCSGGNLIWWVWCGGVLMWWWGSFSMCFVCKTGLCVLCAELVPQMCNIYVF